MKEGKISENALKRSVLKQISGRRPEILRKPAAAEGCGELCITAGENIVVTSCISVASVIEPGKYAVLKAVNAIAAAGAKPLGIELNIMLSPSDREIRLREIMEQADETCGQFGMQIIGGHTQVTDAVKRPIVSACGIGTAESGSVISGAGAKPDMDIILSKWVGIEGTAIIAKERAAELSMRFTAPFIEKAAELENYISVLPEAQLAAEAGVAAMHDVSEGGIYGALWEMADGSGVGLFVDLKKIPIRQETIEISEFFGINPYMLLSGGAMLMAAYDGEALTKKLEEAGIPAAVIGRFTDGKDRIIMKGDERSFLERPQPDEIYGKY